VTVRLAFPGNDYVRDTRAIGKSELTFLIEKKNPQSYDNSNGHKSVNKIKIKRKKNTLA
jgi:hypothetical protein